MKSVESVEADDEPVKSSTSLKTATEFDKASVTGAVSCNYNDIVSIERHSEIS